MPHLRDNTVFRKESSQATKEKFGEIPRKKRGDESAKTQAFKVSERHPGSERRGRNNYDVRTRAKSAERASVAAHDGKDCPFYGQYDQACKNKSRHAESHDDGTKQGLQEAKRQIVRRESVRCMHREIDRKAEKDGGRHLTDHFLPPSIPCNEKLHEKK